MQPLIILILLSFSLSQAWLHTKGGSVDLDMLDEVMDVCGQHHEDFGLCLSLADIRNCEGTVFENHRKVSFNITSQASHILSREKFIKNA